MVPTVFILYANTPEEIIVIIITYIISYSDIGEISPYPTVIIVIIEK